MNETNFTDNDMQSAFAAEDECVRTHAAGIAGPERAFRQTRSDCVAVVNDKGMVQILVAATPLVLGYNAESLTGRSLLDFVHPNDKRRALRTLAGPVGQDGGEQLCKLRLVHRDGSLRRAWLLFSKRFEHPQIRGAVAAMREVTGMAGVLRTAAGAEAMKDTLRQTLKGALSGYGERLD
jgi:PAS domain S-box-containing protein